MKYDFHTHTVFSDGELIPAELARRMMSVGVEGFVITDHVDHSNFEFVLGNVLKACEALTRKGLTVLPGAEITHVRPEDIKHLTRELRKAGARVVLVHGETLVEPVWEGTNAAAVEAGVDVLAHPGLIDEEVAVAAAGKSVLLEVTYRKGHCLGNGVVVSIARKVGAPLCVNSDAHGPEDIMPQEFRRRVALAAGLSRKEVNRIEEEMKQIFKRWWSA